MSDYRVNSLKQLRQIVQKGGIPTPLPLEFYQPRNQTAGKGGSRGGSPTPLPWEFYNPNTPLMSGGGNVTVKQLKQIAGSMDIRGRSKMNKAQLMTAINQQSAGGATGAPFHMHHFGADDAITYDQLGAGCGCGGSRPQQHGGHKKQQRGGMCGMTRVKQRGGDCSSCSLTFN